MKHLKHPRGVKLPNILKAADLIETIPQDVFDMDSIRTGQKKTPKCDSVGCIIGCCTELTPNSLPRYNNGDIDFTQFVETFFGIYESENWTYLFSICWQYTDNTPTGSAARMRYYVANGLPENWEKQMRRKEPLSYK